MVATQQKVYFSYSHREGKKFKVFLEENFKDLISNKTVSDDELNPKRGADYREKLVNEEYIDENTLLIVLVGKSTRCKKHVDWEIYTALKNNCYVIGVILPEIKMPNGRLVYGDIPARLADNVKSGYSKLYTWNYFINYFEEILDTAYQNKIDIKDNINNKRSIWLTTDEEYC